ncbi:hypothetical protein BOTNAR_0929g00010 [Botryotinia narcissicola]|uniref:Uncharacterized protein n=1 Tax=Botryotinia narcissicola TaxID=278944 RepID=A0A4Z1H4M4_9HELO|nr:hypothetical protein BOTNAR_0929g00010 [Botryotinia narcissicola]
MEPHNRSSEEDIINLTPGIFNEVKRLAVTESGLEAYSVMATSNGFSDHYRIEALYIIIKKPRSLLPVDDDLHVQSRWECASLPSCAFILDSNRSVFELKGKRGNEDEQRHLLTQEISRHLTPEFITNSPSLREIRPVSAVKG